MWLSRVTWVLLAILVLSVLLVASLPRIVSTRWVRGQVEGLASEAIRRPVRLGTLSLTWSGNLLLERLEIADAPEFSPAPFVSLGRLAVHVDLLGLVRRTLDLDLTLDGLDVQVIRNTDGRTNLEVFLAGLPPRKPSAGPTTLPFDRAHARIRLGGIRVRAQDRAQGRSATIENASFALDLPALDRPARVELRAGLTLDGRTLPPLSLRARMENLVKPDRTLNLDGATVEADGAFPGGTLVFLVDLAKPTARGRLDADLASLMDVARPFAPSRVAATRIGGRLGVSLDSSPGPDGALAFTLVLAGAGLQVSGGLLEGRALGPVRFDVRNVGTLDRARGLLAVERGGLELQQKSRASWAASVTGLGGRAPEFSVALGGVALDLQEMASLASPFLPHGLALNVGDAKHASSLTLARAEVSGPVSGGVNPVRVADLVLSLPRFGLTSGRTAVSGRDLVISVERLGATLAGFFPRTVSLQARVRCGRLEVSGPRQASAEGIEAVASKLDLGDLARTGGFFGLTARGTGAHSVAARRIALPGLGQVREYRHAAEGEFSIASGDVVSLLIKQARLSIAAVSAETSRGATSVRLDPSPAEPSLALELAGLRVSGRFPAGPNPVELERLTLVLPRIRAKTGAGLVTAEGVRLALRPLAASLRQQFPERVDLRASAGVGRLEMQGEHPVSVKDLEVSSLELGIADLTTAGSALLGVAGRLRLAQSMAAREIEVPGVARMTGVTESLKLGGELAPARAAQVAIEAFSLEAASVRAEAPGVGPVQTRARIGGRLHRVRLRGLETSQIDVEGLHANVAAGGFLTMTLEATARGLGRDTFTSRGQSKIDLAELSRAVPLDALRKAHLSGTAGVQWSLDGRLPPPEGAAPGASKPTGLVQAAGLGFLRQAAVSVNLAGVGASMALTGGQRVALSGLSTEAPLEVRVQNGLLTLNAKLLAEKIEAAPGLGTLREPLGAAIRVQAEQTGPGSLRVSESLAVERLGLTQEAHASLSGLDRLLARGLGSPPALWLMLLGGDLGLSIGVAKAAGLGLVSEKLALRGPLTAGIDLRLLRGEALTVGAWVKAAGAEAALGRTLDAKALDGDVALEKRYRLARVSRDATSLPSGSVRLSEEVLNGRATSAAAPPREATRFGSGNSLRLGFLRSDLAALPIEARFVGIDLSLPNGLPAVERFRADLLGGSVVGSFAVSQPARGSRHQLSVKVLASFTGLDANQLVPGGAPAPATTPRRDDTELSGRLALALPLGTKLESVLAGMDFETDLSHIGARTLDRALYALDPSESNETIVKQRKLLRRGTPRRLKIGIRNGNLSVSGQVQVSGITLDLPRMERINVAGLPGLQRYEAPLASLAPILDLLGAAGADTLEIDDAGHVRFRTGDTR